MKISKRTGTTLHYDDKFFSDKLTSIEKKYEDISFTLSDMIFFLLKISFLIMATIFLFRHSIGGDSLSFREFLNAIPTIGYDSDGVSYFESLLTSLNVREFFEPTEIDVIIIGDLIHYTQVALGLVVYVASALVSSLLYFVDLLGLIF